jgi:hypothetical protein
MPVGKQGRLAEILQKEYKTKGVLSGAASATGKRLREIVDIRNLLFSGGEIGSVIGRKIFGKGYTATPSSDVSNIASKISTPSTATFSKESVDILVSIKSDTRISAKNSSVLPGMARDMNLMRQNISKLLKIQGGSPSYKADMFFKKSSEREKEYESRFNKSTSPVKEESKKGPSFFEVVFSVLTRLFSSPGFLKFAAILGGLVTAGILLYQNFDKIKEKVIALKNAISNAADYINNLFFRDGQVDPKIAGAKTQDVPMNVEPGFADYSYPIPTDSAGDFFNDQALKRVKENTSASGSSTATAETKKFTRQDKQKLSPTQITGLGLLNRIMDREGIRDEELRKRITNLAMVESSLNPGIKGPIIRNEKSMHFGDQAHGLLQIMPKTAEEMGYSREDLKNPEKAAEAGVRYFMKNLKRFSGNLDAATVAHHAGPKRAKEFLETGKVETKDVATGLSTMDYLSKISSLDSPKSTIGQSLSSVSTELASAERQMSMSSGGVVVQDNSVKNVSSSNSGTPPVSSAYNPEWDKLFSLVADPV